MGKFLFELTKHITIGRWFILWILLALCIQSLLYPMEGFRIDNLWVSSARGCVVLATRESDIFVPRAWLPYPLFMAVVLLHPALICFRVRRGKRKAG